MLLVRLLTLDHRQQLENGRMMVELVPMCGSAQTSAANYNDKKVQPGIYRTLRSRFRVNYESDGHE